MHSFTTWKNADGPNYDTNVDKLFPYSEVPYQGEYKLMKIPSSLNDLIQHVDYWGEGRIASKESVLGFSNCYNVNHQYQLVSSGLDLGRKIPNRIPVRDYTNCDTSAYIKDNSVITVTVAGAHITSCAKDIARIVNNDLGKVVVYGVQSDSQEILDLATQLRTKGLFVYPGATLPSEVRGLTCYDSHVVFQNNNPLKDELYNDVVKGNYDSAVNMAKSLAEIRGGTVIEEIVAKLIGSAPRNVMSYAYKLWHGGATEIVRKHFPKSFQHIFNEDAVTIVNMIYNQPLKLDVHKDSDDDRAAWGDNDHCKITSDRVSWKVLPIWNANAVTFKLYNIHRSMYLKLAVAVDDIGDRKVWGSDNSNGGRNTFYLEPLVRNDMLHDTVFFIVNCEYGQALKLDMNTDKIGDRVLWGHNGVYTKYERFRWLITAW